MKVSILIPTHNRVTQLARVLESIARLDRPEGVDLETVICANACSDGTAAMASGHPSAAAMGLKLVEEPRPGLNIARNSAVAASTGDVCALLDDDVWVEGSWLRGLLAGLGHGAEMVSGRTTLWWEEVTPPQWFSPRCERLLTRLDLGEAVVPISTESHVVGANFAFRRSVFNRIGGFHPDLDRAGRRLLSGGDIEFARRALRAGFAAVFSPTMAVLHWVAPERVDRRYLARVSRGRGGTTVALAFLSGDSSVARLGRVGVSQIVVGATRQLGAVLRGDSRDATENMIIRKRGEGTLMALASPWFRARFRRHPR